MTQQLSAILLAKQFFISPWYRDLTVKLFKGPFQERLDRIAEETREEAEEIREQVRDWAETLGAAGQAETAKKVACITRHDILLSLYQAKEAMVEALRVVALNSPAPEMRESIGRLAAIDERHAREIARMIAYEDNPDACPDTIGVD